MCLDQKRSFNEDLKKNPMIENLNNIRFDFDEPLIIVNFREMKNLL